MEAVIDEEFPCKREDGKRFDPFAVAVCNGDIVIGHVPRKISSVCSLYGIFVEEASSTAV